MKKTIMTLITLGITTICLTCSVKAATLNDVATATTATAAAVETGKTAYGSSVVSRMAGRCGAYTQTGSKGIAFEIMFTDKKNLESALKFTENRLKTKLTNCANATAVDVYTLDEVTGNVLERFQLKNTPSTSATRNVVEAVESGKYHSTQLVGTSEAAESFNMAAAKKGITKVMQDSGISVESTELMSDRFLGNTTVLETSFKSATSGAAVGTVLSGGFAFVESMMNGDDAYETTANVATESVAGGIAGGTSTLIACGASEVLAAMGASGIVTTVTPVVVCIGSAVMITYVIEGIIDTNNIKELVATYTKKGCEMVAESVEILKVKIDEANIAEHLSDTAAFITEKITNTAEYAKSAAVTTGDAVSGMTQNLVVKCQTACK